MHLNLPGMTFERPFLMSQSRFLKSYLVLKETNRYSGLRQNACYHRCVSGLILEKLDLFIH